MRREDEYRQLANSVRERPGDEESALLRAQWEILAGSYVRLADQSATNREPKKIDDTGTYDDPIPWDRTLRKKALAGSRGT
jgi:hypothetical protein